MALLHGANNMVQDREAVKSDQKGVRLPEILRTVGSCSFFRWHLKAFEHRVLVGTLELEQLDRGLVFEFAKVRRWRGVLSLSRYVTDGLSRSANLKQSFCDCVRADARLSTIRHKHDRLSCIVRTVRP